MLTPPISDADIGKKFRRRDGKIAVIEGPSNDKQRPYLVLDPAYACHFSNGLHCDPNGECEYDLVARVEPESEERIKAAIAGGTKAGWERERFEEAAFAQYFLSTITRNPSPPQPKISGALDFISEDCVDKVTFLAKRPDGSYERDTLNSAWWAWSARAALSPEAPQ